MGKDTEATQDYEDNFERLNKDLNELAEMIRSFTKNANNREIKPQIKQLLSEMFFISKKIGGSVLEHAKDLKLDVDLFLNHPNTKELGPKIFQDFQLLKNDLRRL